MPSAAPAPPSFRAALRFWLKLGCISFGGPAGQIAVMHRELVERKGWISERSFLHALNFCMLLPGPEATQLATYCGWRLHGLRGGVAAGVLFVLPGAVVLWGLSWIYVVCGSVPAVNAVFHGLKAAVLALVVSALLRVGRRALRTPAAWAIAGAAFVGLFFLHLPFPAIVLGALGIGWIGGRLFPRQFGREAGPDPLPESDARAARPPTLRVAAIGVALCGGRIDRSFLLQY